MRAALIATFLAVSTVGSLPADSRTAADESPPALAGPSPAPNEAQPAAAGSPAATQNPPLIAYAIELGQSNSHPQDKALYVATTNLRTITSELSRNPPPSDTECANTLGASRFAEQYERLGSLHEQLGDFEAVIEVNESAFACQPRVASYLASIASAQLSLGHIEEARATAERGNVIDADDEGVRFVRGRLDFVQERWADATARFRLEVVRSQRKYTGSVYVDYARCFLWLAQRRAGVREPELPKPDEAGKPPRKEWPAQILETLRGELSEKELVQVIRDADNGEAKEWLTEALFYVGELRLAEGDTETARRHFASVINLRMLNFVEYGMARAELRKMRASAEAAARAR